MKECIKCKKIKDYSGFYIHRETIDGYRGSCKECCNKQTIKKHFENRGKRLKRQKQYDLEHKEERKEYRINRRKIKEEYDKIYNIKRRVINPTLSKGEDIIKGYLNKLNIKYRQEESLGCKNPKTNCQLYFDFYLFDYNLCIEYDGEQHYEPLRFKNGIELLKKVQYRDKIKNQFCKANNIKLLRIPYWKQGNIEQILTAKLAA